MESSTHSTRFLKMVLAVILFVAVCLGVVIFVVMQNKNNETPIVVDDADYLYELTEQINQDFLDGDRNGAVEQYDTLLSQAIQEEDYDEFLQILSYRDGFVPYNGGCDILMNSYKTLDINNLPDAYKVNYYGTAAASSAECGDTEMEKYYNQELTKLLEKEAPKDEKK